MDPSFRIGDFIAGWIGGVCGLVVGHPLDTVKVRQQAFNTSLFVTISRTFRHEGIFGFYKGMLGPLITLGPSNAILFGVYGNMMNILEENYIRGHISYADTSAMKHSFIAGTVAGLFQVFFTCPAEFIKILMQIKTEGKGSWVKHSEVQYTGSINAFYGLIRDRGITGLFRGFVPMFYRDVPTSGLFVVTYEGLLTHFKEKEIPLLLSQTIAGGCAGVASWIFVIPFDVVKSRIQADSYSKPVYRGMMDCFVKSYKHEGMEIFFKGTTAIISRTFVVNAALFVGYEAALKQMLK